MVDTIRNLYVIPSSLYVQDGTSTVSGPDKPFYFVKYSYLTRPPTLPPHEFGGSRVRDFSKTGESSLESEYHETPGKGVDRTRNIDRRRDKIVRIQTCRRTSVKDR